MEEIRINVQLKTKDMFAFLAQHAYSKFSGLFGVFLSIFAFIALCINFREYDDTQKVVLVFISLMFTVINPAMLLLKAKKQIVGNPVYKNPLEYVFCEEGIKVLQGEQQVLLEWNMIKRVTEGRMNMLVYTSTIHAFIFPMDAIGDKLPKIHRMFLKNVNQEEVRLPKSMKKDLIL